MDPDAIRLLLVESDPEQERRVREALAGAHATRVVLEHVPAAQDAALRLERGDVDVLLVDLHSDEQSAVELVQLAADRAPGVSVVIVADDPANEGVLRAVRAGADECLARDEVAEPALAHALRWALERHRLLAESRQRALRDEPSGLYNLNGFLAVTDPVWRLAARTARPLSLMLLHFDRLAELRREHGDEPEAQAIHDAAMLLLDVVRDSDVLARLAHDRFGLLLNDAERETCETVLMRILESVEEYNTAEPRAWRLSFSVTFAHFDPRTPRSIEQLLAEAERSLEERRLKSFRLG